MDDEAFDSYAVKLIEEIYATSACAVGKVEKDTGFRLPFGLSFAPADLETGDVEVEGDVASATDEDEMLGRREAEDLSCTDSDVEPPSSASASGAAASASASGAAASASCWGSSRFAARDWPYGI